MNGAARVVGWLLAAALVCACGARSDLQIASEGTGAAGATGTGGSGDGGRGGDGGGGSGGGPYVRDCDPEAGVTYIYLVTQQNEVFSFDPSEGALQLRGTLDCPTVGPTPYSMAVDRKGVAYILFTDGNLFRARVADASCESTDYVPEQLDFGVFGMGFATDQAGPEESLFVAEINPNGPSDGLGRIDVEELQLGFIGPFSQTFGRKIELTGTGDGRLFGYFLAEPGPGGELVEIDKRSATILSATPLSVGPPGSDLAFAFWGGDFYVFTTQASGVGTDVTRYRPSDGSLVVVTTLSSDVVGAGVSTCAPQ